MRRKRLICAALVLVFLLAQPMTALTAEQAVETPPAVETSDASTPETPEAPEVPETPETPETPEVPETPDVPEIPETPETPAGETADVEVQPRGQILFNPYGAVFDWNGEITVRQITSTQARMVNNGETPVAVGASVKAAEPEGGEIAFLDSPFSPETQGKAMFMYVEFQRVSEDGTACWAQEYGTQANQLPVGGTEDELFVLQPGECAVYRIFGNMGTNLPEGEFWTDAELASITLSVDFTFTAPTEELPADLSDPAETPNETEPSNPAETPDGTEPSSPAEVPDGTEPSDPAETPDGTKPSDPAETPNGTESSDPAEVPGERVPSDLPDLPDVQEPPDLASDEL